VSLTLLWLVALGVPLAFGLWAQRKVRTTFDRYSEVRPTSGLTGAQAAQVVLDASGLDGVSINPVKGRLTDHYNPRNRTLNLSEPVCQTSSISALGVAAHEAGHALQDAQGYGLMKVRQTLVPVAQIGSSLWFFPVLLGFIMGISGLITLGLVLFSAIVLFQAVTLPVEFDASKRALMALENQGILVGNEVDGARQVLSAAAWTYIAAFVASLAQLLYFFVLSRR
jgi:Zn-dependent membrane protease YugP